MAHLKRLAVQPERRLPFRGRLFPCWLIGLVAGTAILPISYAAEAAAEATILTANGQTVTGEVQSIDEGRLVARTSDGEQRSWGLDELATLQFSNEDRTGPAGRVTLWDGSRIAIEHVTLGGGQERLIVQPRLQSALGVALERVRSIRFQAPTVATDPLWLGLVEEAARGDRVVVRRDEKTLEPVSVLIRAISRESVGFELSGRSVEAPLGRLEGILLAGNPPELPDAAVQVEDVFGSRWVAQEIRLPPDADEFIVRWKNGWEHRIAKEQLQSIQFAGGILMLTEAEVADADTAVPEGLAVDPSLIANWFGPKVQGNAILMQGPSEATYRIPDGFRRLVGSVRRNDEVERFGPASVQIRLDDRIAWEVVMTDDRSLGFELPLDGARRLTLCLSESPGGTIGDCVDWVGVRLLK